MTTNSGSGEFDIEKFYPIFRAMETHGLVLNIHGEMQSSRPEEFADNPDEAVTVMNAEEQFLPSLFKVHETFPRLRIVLEHVSTKRGVEAVLQCGPMVSLA